MQAERRCQHAGIIPLTSTFYMAKALRVASFLTVLIRNAILYICGNDGFKFNSERFCVYSSVSFICLPSGYI